MKITYNKLIKMTNTIQQIGQVEGSPKFTYGIIKNQNKINKVLSKLYVRLNADFPEPVGYEEYMKAVQDVQHKYVSKDKEGNPCFEEADKEGFRKYKFKDIETAKLYSDECDKLEKVHEDAIFAYQQRINAMEQVKFEEVEFDPHLIEVQYAPSMPVAAMGELQDLFVDRKSRIIES